MTFYTESISSKPLKDAPPVEAANPGNPTGFVDPLELAFLEVLNAASLASGNAAIKVKELAENAKEQEKLNDKEKALSWCKVPPIKWTTHREEIWHFHHRGHMDWWHTVEVKEWKTSKNLDEVRQAQLVNAETMNERQVLSSKIMGLQQSSQIASAEVNATTDTSLQTVNEGSKILDVLQQMTYKALLRRPPK